jgi:hypothetical protein
VAFYGRCSTEDNQDPQTSLGWQLGNARTFVEPLGGQVVAESFDIGQSRSVPWERRDEASRLLAQLKRAERGWLAVVVGEGTRCWFGNQFSLIAPRFGRGLPATGSWPSTTRLPRSCAGSSPSTSRERATGLSPRAEP